MARFIQVTKYGNGERMSINVDHIQYVDECSDHACLNFNDNDYVQLEETYDDVMVLIDG